MNLFRSVKHLGRFRPRNFKVNYRLRDVNGLRELVDKYDLFPLDRDCTLQEYHGKREVPEFEETLEAIKGKSEIISNSSFRTFLGIRDVYQDLPVNKLVRFSGFGCPHLLRIEDGELRIFSYVVPSGTFSDATEELKGPNDSLVHEIEHPYDKPDPLVVRAVIDYNVFNGRVGPDPRTLMVGDAYLTDIVAGNLAGANTARVKPYKPFSNPWWLIAMRGIDSVVGTGMSRIAKYDS